MTLTRRNWNDGVDEKALEREIRKATHYLNRVREGVKIGSINTDVDYGYAFEAVESIYNIANIGVLAGENGKRLKKEKKARGNLH